MLHIQTQKVKIHFTSGVYLLSPHTRLAPRSYSQGNRGVESPGCSEGHPGSVRGRPISGVPPQGVGYPDLSLVRRACGVVH